MKEKINKRDILTSQINIACSLYLDKEYICSLTLSGSAETLSEGLLEANGLKESASNAVFVKFKRFLFEWRNEDIPRTNVILRDRNWARNVIKHHNKSDEEIIEINIKLQSFIVLKSCLENYRKLGLVLTKPMRDFEAETRDYGG
ncbi:hypothetical protein [Vibrio fluvialis]|uniref:hypothetical protein n=1 Tax=Vibrio fluvialis TaxID=676 RepID=UPI001EEAA9CA|nr:hypothetical protein [Vibrio fluvialis]MCG6413205.1 hypothetical protein [Vibrio fluvialis]